MLKSVIAAAGLCATIAQAQSADLSGGQINDLVAGATVEIDTPVGTKLPIRYGRDGKLIGKAGDLAWYLGAATDNGRWWVASDRLCHKWRHWFSSEPQCMRLSKQGRTIRWRNRDGYSGTATISVPPPIRAAAVLPPARLALAEEVVASEVPPTPAAAAPHPDKPKARPSAESPASAGQPPRPVVKEAAKPPPAETRPAPAMSPPPPQPPHPVVKGAAGPPPVEARPAPSPPPRKHTKTDGVVQLMFKVANVRSDDLLNVRSGPSADFAIVAKLPPGSRGIAITSACRASWCPVQHRATSGWVNSAYLTAEEPVSPLSALRDTAHAPRACLTAAARALLDRIERRFGRVQVISTCRPGATIPGTWRASRHASGNAVDFNAGSRKAAIVEWLVANHRSGGTMTYSGTDHIHVDIGPHFVSIAGGPHRRSWRESRGGGSGLR